MKDTNFQIMQIFNYKLEDYMLEGGLAALDAFTNFWIKLATRKQAVVFPTLCPLICCKFDQLC